MRQPINTPLPEILKPSCYLFLQGLSSVQRVHNDAHVRCCARETLVLKEIRRSQPSDVFLSLLSLSQYPKEASASSLSILSNLQTISTKTRQNLPNEPRLWGTRHGKKTKTKHRRRQASAKKTLVVDFFWLSVLIYIFSKKRSDGLWCFAQTNEHTPCRFFQASPPVRISPLACLSVHRQEKITLLEQARHTTRYNSKEKHTTCNHNTL